MNLSKTEVNAAGTGFRVGEWVRGNALPIVMLGFLIVLPFIVGWLTESSPYGVERGDRFIMRGASVRWQSVLIEIYILGILAMSYNLLFGFTGIISFGHALFFGSAGYVLGLALEYTELDTTLALLVGVAVSVIVCGLLGLLVGLVTLRLKGVYFAIFTLAVAEMFFIFVGRWSLTNAEDGFAIADLPIWLDPAQNRLNFYYIALVLFVLTFVFIRRLIDSPTGAVFKAIRENEDRAQTLGYDTLRYKLFALVVAAVLAGLAGLLQVILNKKVGPELLNVSNTVNPMLMTIIGGIGTLGGPVIGAAGLHLLDILLRESQIVVGETTVDVASIWGLLLGAIFVLAVIVFPYGIVGTWQRLWKRRRIGLDSPLTPKSPLPRKRGDGT
jgi:branched-chain amino acid transport system permease protein